MAVTNIPEEELTERLKDWAYDEELDTRLSLLDLIHKALVKNNLKGEIN